MSPVKPADLKLLLINPGDEPCDAYRKLLRSIYLYYLLVRYETKEDGAIGDGLAADLCALECPDT